MFYQASELIGEYFNQAEKRRNKDPCLSSTMKIGKEDKTSHKKTSKSEKDLSTSLKRQKSATRIGQKSVKVTQNYFMIGRDAISHNTTTVSNQKTKRIGAS
jgi:hypothetical protein